MKMIIILFDNNFAEMSDDKMMSSVLENVGNACVSGLKQVESIQ